MSKVIVNIGDLISLNNPNPNPPKFKIGLIIDKQDVSNSSLDYNWIVLWKGGDISSVWISPFSTEWILIQSHVK